MEKRHKVILEKYIALSLSVFVLLGLLKAVTVYHEAAFVFADRGLEAAVRENLEKPTGIIGRTELLQITHLDASNRDIVNLKGIENLRRLVALNLENNYVEDLSPLRTLRHLRELNVRNNAILDLHAVHFDDLSGLNLHRLNLRHNVFRPKSGQQLRLTDISLLEPLTSLEELDLRDNHIEDITPLRGMSNMRRLNLRENRVRDITPLSKMTELQYINVHSNTDIHSIMPLASLTKLETVILRHVPIGNQIRIIEELPNITYVNVNNCGVTDIALLQRIMSMTETEDTIPQETELPTVRINEVMASNGSTFVDEDGDYEDWIELYNYGDAPVDISGWGLSDNISEPFKWRFPKETIISPDEYLIVWASGKSTNATNLHTNFSISMYGEPILLTSQNGDQIDYMPALAIPRNLTLGRLSNKEDSWFYFTEPTPEGANTNTAYTAINDPVSFSHNGGFYTTNFLLTLTHHDPDTIIVYTLDGSDPCINNLNGTSYLFKNQYPVAPDDEFGDFLTNYYISHVYTEPLKIYDCSQEPDRLTHIATVARQTLIPASPAPVSKAMIIRARAYSKGTIPSKRSGHTYFVSPNGNPYSIPVISLQTQESALFCFEEGIYTPGAHQESRRKRFPESNVTHGNFDFRGREWERILHFEYIEPNEAQVTLNTILGFRIHGNVGRRSRPLKSLRLYVRRKYANTSNIRHRFFNDKNNLPTHLRTCTFKRLLLRNGGHPPCYIRDISAHKIMAPVFDGIQRGRNAIHYINGEFWGVVQIKDRQDRFHLAYNHNLEPDNIIILDGVWGEGHPRHIDTGYTEDLMLYRDMYRFIIENDMNKSENYTVVKDMMDIINYIDYNIMFIYMRNEDWHGYKHFKYWRVRNTCDNPYGDGRWRFMVRDFDICARRNPSDNYLAVATHPEGGGEPRPFGDAEKTALLRNLLESTEFQHLFINRFADHINTTFQPERVKTIAQRYYDEIMPYNEQHYHRWNEDVSSEPRLNSFISFFNHRPYYQRQHIREHFDIASDIKVTLDVSNNVHGYLRINTIKIIDETPGVVDDDVYPWTGIYFSDIPITIEAIPAAGKQFKKWIIQPTITDKTSLTDPLLSLVPTTNIVVTAVFN